VSTFSGQGQWEGIIFEKSSLIVSIDGATRTLEPELDADEHAQLEHPTAVLRKAGESVKQ
jgi:hypothetical protein